MAAVFYRSQMSCPWCNAQIQVSPGWNLQIFIDCTGCKRRFSISKSTSTTDSHVAMRTAWDYVSNPNSNSYPENGTPNVTTVPPTETRANNWNNAEQPGPAQRQNRTSLQFIHLMIDPSNGTKPLKPKATSLRWLLVKYTSSFKRSKDPLLYFDIGFDPRNHDNLKDRRSKAGMTPVPEEDRILSASSHCFITDMNIVCPKVGVVMVSRRDGIRCIDVFDAIFQTYNEPMRQTEYPGPDVKIERYMRHFKARCDACPNPSREFWVGMRRVDLLRGRRIFDGLTRLGSDWELKLEA
ncbi:hypothetical protein R3P38DRAFT_1320394 [Favolaschia claudopus]|uniref:DUF6699 domain-containing protein n=1 Tax=Favolaschia claudopus TaxID=2862362 RepID=A0AAV9ZM93_9AGAR